MWHDSGHHDDHSSDSSVFTLENYICNHLEDESEMVVIVIGIKRIDGIGRSIQQGPANAAEWGEWEGSFLFKEGGHIYILSVLLCVVV